MSNARFLEKRVAGAFYGRFPRLREAQEAAIEPILAGRNVVLSAGTGSGKTEAVMAPLVSSYWQEFFRLDTLVIVYISPTRALANDLHRRLEPILDRVGLRIGIRHGDRDDLRKKTKPHIVITTPESVDVLLLRQDEALKTALAVVIDEVHLLYNTQRGIQLSVLMQRLQRVVNRPPLQMVAMSATIANLLDTARLIFGAQANTKLLSFPSQRPIHAVIRADAVAPMVVRLTKARAAKLLGFVNSRKNAEWFAEELSSEPHLEKAVFPHYSKLAPHIRRETEEEFAKRRTAVCFATSTLELGIDIGDIDAVLLCGVPSGIASFLQRIGRGNRREEKANVVCFLGADSILDDKPPPEPPLVEALRYIALIETARQGQLPNQHRYELFGAVAQQCLSFIASRQGKYTSFKDLTKLFEHLDYVQEAHIVDILDGLTMESYLIRHKFKDQYGAGELLHRLIDDKKIYGNFPVEPRQVKLVHKERELGKIPKPSLEKLSEGTHFLFDGKKWTIRKIEEDAVLLTPAPAEAFAKPFSYIGRKPRFDAFLTNKMWHLIHETDFPLHLLHADLQSDVDTARRVAQSIFTVDEIPYTERDDIIRYYTFGGFLVNRSVAFLHGHRDRKGVTDCYLEVPEPIDWESVPADPAEFQRVFRDMAKYSSGKSVFQALLPQELQVREGIQEWLCDQAIRDVLRRLTGSKTQQCPAGDGPFPLERAPYLEANGKQGE